MIRLTPDPVDYDAVVDGGYSDYPESGTGAVAVFTLKSPNGDKFQLIFNTTDTTINPNADTTYDAAAIGSLFINGAGGKFYVKSDATTWTEVT